MKFIDCNFNRDDDYLYLGKVIKTSENYLALDWVYAGLSFSFKGSGVIFYFDEYDDALPTYIKVYIDNNREEKHSIYLKSNIVVIDSLDDKDHVIDLMRICEGENPLLLKGFSIMGSDPKMLPKRERKYPRLFFIGDSITAGFGVNGNKEHMEYHTYEEDATSSYAYYTKVLLDSEIEASAHSGRGIVLNYINDTGRPLMKDMFVHSTDNIRTPYDYKDYEPSIVIINAGTNDISSNVNKDDLEAGVLELLKTIRSKFNNAPILFLYGVCTNKYADVIEKAVNTFSKDDKRASFLLVDTVDSLNEEKGSYNHPGIETSKRVSKILANEIKKILEIKV